MALEFWAKKATISFLAQFYGKNAPFFSDDSRKFFGDFLRARLTNNICFCSPKAFFEYFSKLQK